MEYAWDIFYFQYSPAFDETKIERILDKYHGFSRIIGFYKRVVGIPYLTKDLSAIPDKPIFDLQKELSPFGKTYDVKKICSECFDFEVAQAPYPLETFEIRPKKGLFKRLRADFPDAVVAKEKRDRWVIKFQFSFGHKKALLNILDIFGVKIEDETYLWLWPLDTKFLGKYLRNRETKEVRLMEWYADANCAFVGAKDENGKWAPLSNFSPAEWEGPILSERLITSWREIWNSS